MPNQNYLLIGTTTVDIVNDGRILGGTVSYAAPIAKRFGHNVRILTSTAQDEPLIEPLHNLADVKNIPSEYSSTFSNIYSDTGRTQIVHHASDNLTSNMLPPKWQSSELVHLAPLVDDVDTNFAKIFPNATILLTPQGYMRKWGDDGIVRFKPFLDTEALNSIDILVLSKQDILDAPELEDEFPKYTKHVVVTNGDEGGTYYHNGDSYHYDAYPATETDPTGAGDVFAASLLASLPLLDNDMIAALKVAARLAALAVTVKGAKIAFSQETIQQVIQEAKI